MFLKHLPFNHVKKIFVEFFIIVVCAISLLVVAINLWLTKRKLKSEVHIENERNFEMKKEGKISIIIATKNQSRSIGQTLRHLESTTLDKSRVEIIIVDVGSMDNTIGVAKASSGAIPVTFIKGLKDFQGGRGKAINEGYAKSSGEILFILRADSLVPFHYDETLRNEFNDPRLMFAAFKFSIDRKAIISKNEPPGLWILERFLNLRSNYFWYPSAMQGLALTSHNFYSHQFSDGVILDDVLFYLKIRSTCLSRSLKFKLLDQPIYSSPIRWEAVGVLLWIFLDSVAQFLFINMNICPEDVYVICYDFLPHLLRK